MPEVQEVFEMATQKVRPDPNALERQHHDQRQHVARRKGAVFVLVGALLLGGVALGITVLRDDTNAGSTPGAGGAPTSPIPSLPGGSLEPGRYVFSSSDPGLDASHRITIEVPDGYAGFDGVAAVAGTNEEAWVITLAISGVYADACQWKGTLLDGSALVSNDDVVAALANQKGLRVSTPTGVTVDGFAGTYMERRVPAETRISDCNGAIKTPDQHLVFKVYRSPGFGDRVLRPGQLQQLWILDIDGVPLVIEAGLDAGTSAQVRAELLQMVESIQIDPREEG